MEQHNRLQTITDYYEQLNRQIQSDMGGHTFPTQGHGRHGVFSPNPTDYFIDIIVNGILDQRGTTDIDSLRDLKFLSAGSGDGRGLAICSTFRMKPYGIEIDGYLVDLSLKARDDLAKSADVSFEVAKGNFLDDSAYDRLGVPFGDFDYVFHSLNNIDVFDLIENFGEDAKLGASLILLGGPGLADFSSDARVNGLQFSRLYEVYGSRGVQGIYVFMRNP